MSAHLAIAAAAGLAALAAVKSKVRGSQSQSLSMGTNDLGWALIQVSPALDQYPEAPLYFRKYLTFEIETRVDGRFREAMQLVEAFARNQGYTGILLHEQAQYPAEGQEELKDLYRGIGYTKLSPEEMYSEDDEDVFFVKDFLNPRRNINENKGPKHDNPSKQKAALSAVEQEAKDLIARLKVSGINSVLRLCRPYLEEKKPCPKGWDNLLAYGRTRIVFASRVDPRFVIKVDEGGYSNRREAGVYSSAGPILKKLLVPVLAVDPDGEWLIMERVSLGKTSADMIRLSSEIIPKINQILGHQPFDIHEENVSSDGRLLDYGDMEPSTLVGSRARMEPAAASTTQRTSWWQDDNPRPHPQRKGNP